MKVIVKVSFVFMLGLMVGCADPEPTFDQKLEDAVCDYYQVDSLEYAKVVDTLFVSDLDSLISVYNEAGDIFKEQNVKSKENLDSAEVWKANTQASLDELSFEMLRPFFEENLVSFQKTIEQEKLNMAFADSMIVVGNEWIDYFNEVRSSATGKKALYTVESKIEGEVKFLDVSPEFKVLKELDFSK